MVYVELTPMYRLPFNQQFYPELNAPEIQRRSNFSYDHPREGEGILGDCKKEIVVGLKKMREAGGRFALTFDEWILDRGTRNTSQSQ